MVGDLLQIDVRTESAVARELVAGRAAELAAALEQHGIQLDRFDVTYDPYSKGEGGASDSNRSGSLMDSDRQREDQTRESLPSVADLSEEEGSASVAADAQPTLGVVAETRLDIRI